jgi:hypothetical protein
MVIVHNHQKICLWETKKQNALQTDEPILVIIPPTKKSCEEI